MADRRSNDAGGQGIRFSDAHMLAEIERVLQAMEDTANALQAMR